MKKPEYLTGECKTFLELVVSDKKHLYSGDGIAQFYSQHFTKDMIVRPEIKYREGIYSNEGLTPELIEKIGVSWQSEIDRNNWQPLFKGEWEWLNRHYVDYKTADGKGQILVSNVGSIDDFIREAKKAGIKLEWK